jgi:hypothetical protein
VNLTPQQHDYIHPLDKLPPPPLPYIGDPLPGQQPTTTCKSSIQ